MKKKKTEAPEGENSQIMTHKPVEEGKYRGALCGVPGLYEEKESKRPFNNKKETGGWDVVRLEGKKKKNPGFGWKKRTWVVNKNKEKKMSKQKW